jgi:hypothetical protein
MHKEPEFYVINIINNKRIPLIHKQTVIGRNPNLSVHVNDISVSSKHATIELTHDFTKAYLM